MWPAATRGTTGAVRDPADEPTKGLEHDER
jgi:hypothetical protein